MTRPAWAIRRSVSLALGSSSGNAFDQAKRPNGVGAGGLDHGRDCGDRLRRELQGATKARRQVPGVAQRIDRREVDDDRTWERSMSKKVTVLDDGGTGTARL